MFAPLLMLFLLMPMSSQAATTIQSLDDAAIAHDSAAGSWMIKSGGATLTVALDPSRDFQVVSLVGASSQNWIVVTRSSPDVIISGVPLAFGSRAAGFQYESAAASNDGHTLRLDGSFVLPSAGVRATRHIVVTPGSPTFEIWTSFQALDVPVAVANLNAFQLSVPAGTLHWLNGLQGDNADTEIDSA